MLKGFKRFVPTLLVVLLLVTGVTQALAAPPVQTQMDIVDTAVADGRFTTLATALTTAGLVDTLKGPGPFTVFAPTDEAFAKLPAGALDGLLADKEALTKVLLYHVVSGKVMAADVVNLSSADTVAKLPVSIKVEGDKVMVGDAQVIITDVEASNGVIHVIDTVLLPPAEPAAEPAMAEASKDIVDTAVADGRFTTLATALTAAGLVDTLKGSGPFTVFAPTDEAFAKLPAGTLDSLLADKEALTKVLTYHVVSGKVMAADVATLNSAETIAQLPVSIKVQDGNVFLNNDSKVIITDVAASNGVIHVIDTVLLPPTAEPAASAPVSLPATGGDMPANTYLLIATAALGLVLLGSGLALRFLAVRR